MFDVFGWPYPQHETYYLMVGNRDHRVFLGLREDAEVAEFHREAEQAAENGTFDIERYVQVFPAQPHQLFCVPAGTPHGSGVGNVVLEVSATPYLYSLRFCDWLRRDAAGRQRPVHVDHAFENLNTSRTGAAIVPTWCRRREPCAMGSVGTRLLGPCRRCSSRYAGSCCTQAPRWATARRPLPRPQRRRGRRRPGRAGWRHCIRARIRGNAGRPRCRGVVPAARRRRPAACASSRRRSSGDPRTRAGRDARDRRPGRRG